MPSSRPRMSSHSTPDVVRHRGNCHCQQIRADGIEKCWTWRHLCSNPLVVPWAGRTGRVTGRFYKPGSRSASAPSPVGAGTLQDGAGSCTLGWGAGWTGAGYNGATGCTGTAGDGVAVCGTACCGCGTVVCASALRSATVSQKLTGRVSWSVADLVNTAIFLGVRPEELMDDALIEQIDRKNKSPGRYSAEASCGCPLRDSNPGHAD